MRKGIIMGWMMVLAFLMGMPLGAEKAKETSGLFPVQQNGRYGYIDRTGKMVIKPQFEHAENFSEGLALVSVGGKIGYIDKTGKLVITPQFDLATDFSEGMARVRIDEKSGYIDPAFGRTGKYVWEPTK